MPGRKARAASRRSRATGSTSREPDDGLRGRVAVVASLVNRPDGTVRLVLDDALSTGGAAWKSGGLFTSRDYPGDAFRAVEIDPDELEQLGLNIVTRLVAMTQVRGA